MAGPAVVPSRRAAAVAPFHVMRILERARALEADGRDLIHLEVGEPDFPTPEPVIAEARAALASAPLGYTPAAGLPRLRQAIADHYRRRYGVAVDPARIIVTPGGSGALQLALAAVVDVGDSVLLTEPGYPCNRHIVSLIGGRPRVVPVGPETGYRLSAADARAVWQADVRALLLASPSNPTGAVMSAAAIAELQALAGERGAALIVDEIYQGLTYGVEDHTALSAGGDNVFVVNSFSKYFGMTGWRLGWLVVPPAFAETVSRLAQNLYLAAPTVSQHAALAALRPQTLSLLDQRRDAFRLRRDVLLDLLSDLGFGIPATPEGAFYIYARIPAHCADAATLAETLLETANVAVTPGLDFGGDDSGRMLRFAYTVGPARLREAAARIATVAALPC
ncbi:aminotransferase class I/II-fold pyridoxal phosphate-dependent enzyme [Thiohalocapsa marina]|uniref:Aminotransferase n=1 Tax=Thiohalocapsa marina TaxID=424902 RepID=A0A5M8FKQ8_9GAMM|nr:aminotransferase class I/II-fold pyridoxal phosphate-dependent enzyme [Thiohalocapsa marina]KAA6185488.1 aminotransferase class I/II-fold pyridoxal phosphate-dependent enzyme [Thiohalocapsa marina]